MCVTRAIDAQVSDNGSAVRKGGSLRPQEAAAPTVPETPASRAAGVGAAFVGAPTKGTVHDFGSVDGSVRPRQLRRQ